MNQWDLTDSEYDSLVAKQQQVKIECQECSGSGELDKLRCSSMLSSDCCGGCYTTEDCSECNGQGHTIKFLKEVDGEEFELW